MTVDEAYRVCEQVTRAEARNFSSGIRLLPGPKRRALSAVYALARRIDDVGDGALAPAAKLAALDQLRAAVGADSADPVLAAVADAGRRFPLPLQAFRELVDGVERDVRGATYESFEDLVGYCRLVAGTVGRLCVGVYGTSDPGDLPRAMRLADDLGVALQQTNVLRDVREDLLSGRVYLPAEDLRRHGVELVVSQGVLGGPAPRLADLVRTSAARAEDWYVASLPLLGLLDRRSAACTAAMAGIYRRLNARIGATPAAITTGRVSLSGAEKAAVAGRALLGRTP